MFDIAENIHKAKNNKRIVWFVLIKIKRELKWLNVEEKAKKRRKKVKKEEEDKLYPF